MTTGQTNSGLAVNATAISEAVKKAARERCAGLPSEFLDEVIEQALECISDEFSHHRVQTNINKTISSRIEVLADVAEQHGCEL